MVFTNGTLLDNNMIIEKIIDSKLLNLVISFDGSCENTYKDIRGKGIFEKIKNNIRLLNKIKEERNSGLPSISLFCTIMDRNIEELMNIVYLAKELGLICIGFQPVVTDNTDARMRGNIDANWISESRYDVLDDSINKLLEYKLTNKKNLRFISSSLTQLLLIKKYFRSSLSLSEQKCYMGLNRIIISQDRKMYFCAAESNTGEISFGDIHTDRLKDLWYSKKARIFRKSIKGCIKPCLLGGARRDDFDKLMDEFYYEFFYKTLGKFIKKDTLYKIFSKFI
jgi:sulfatase maturation enzyme AslB (radical SAM superfamily)